MLNRHEPKGSAISLIPDQLSGAGVLRCRKAITGVETYYVLVRSGYHDWPPPE